MSEPARVGLSSQQSQAHARITDCERLIGRGRRGKNAGESRGSFAFLLHRRLTRRDVQTHCG